jgi:hypothetical protein
MPFSLQDPLIRMHLRFKGRNAPKEPAPQRDAINAPEASGARYAPAPHTPRAKLNLPLYAYPLIKSCLDRIEAKTGKGVGHYAGPLVASTGCDTIGELLELTYADLKSGQYNGSLTNALEAYITKALKYDAPRRLVMIIGTSFEDEACDFEGVTEDA